MLNHMMRLNFEYTEELISDTQIVFNISNILKAILGVRYLRKKQIKEIDENNKAKAIFKVQLAIYCISEIVSPLVRILF